MDQLVYTVGGQAGIPGRAGAADLLRLLEARLLGYESLAQSLLDCRQAYAQADLNGIAQFTETQSAHCHEIHRMEENIQMAQEGAGTRPLKDSEARRASEVQRRTKALRETVAGLNRTNACIVQKAAHNNAVLRNLYANVLVYANPRTTAGGIGSVEA